MSGRGSPPMAGVASVPSERGLVTEVEEPAREVGADEPGAPGNKDSLDGHRRIVSDLV